MKRFVLTLAFPLVLAACVTPPASTTTTFLSVQDGRAALNNGAPAVNSAPDSLAVVELSGGRLVLKSSLALPTSLVGPPSSIAVSPDGSFALVSSATKRDPKDPGKVIGNDEVSVVALDGPAPSVVATLRTDEGASGISINRAGTLALVANRAAGTVSVLSIAIRQVKVIDKLVLPKTSGPSHAQFTPDGRMALVSRDGDHRISVLRVEGDKVTLDRRDLSAGIRPYGLDIAADGAYAVVTNVGVGNGDRDTLSLIDLRADPPRVVDTVTVGQTPEAAFFWPDGRHLGVSVIDGSNKPAGSPFLGTASYQQYEVVDGRLVYRTRVTGGAWLQGSAFTADGRHAIVQDAMNRQLRLYRYDGGQLVDTGERLQLEAAPSAIKRWR